MPKFLDVLDSFWFPIERKRNLADMYSSNFAHVCVPRRSNQNWKGERGLKPSNYTTSTSNTYVIAATYTHTSTQKYICMSA